ncbi:MAG: Molybdenum cofactor synthesis domain protein [Pedosphaera sp.]|nr:Molybdenum cofactor synthesis domain protein [Pedosphaera sp.]
MLEYEAALARILATIPATQPERVPLAQAHRRILAERILSPLDLPPFDNSAMDGYAVRAKDVQGATTDSPKSLRLRGKVAAGETFTGAVETGGCVRIFTGSPLPPGADAVIMQEDTRTDPSKPDTVWFLDAVKPWENVRFRGEDMKHGVVADEAGGELSAGRVNLLAALGLAGVMVGKQPLTGLLASGSELIEAGQPLTPGGIYESNRIGLAALITQAGAVPKVFPLVKDTLAETREALAAAFAECDVVITSGGVSVGELDFIKSAFEELGGELQFWKVAIKPGRPFVFGQWRGKFLFGLPGNPVSAFVTFLLLVRPALRRWQGAAEVNLPRQTAALAESLSNSGGRRHFMRVRIDDAGLVRSAGTQASHILHSLASANALVDVPPGTTLPAGSPVQALRWE